MGLSSVWTAPVLFPAQYQISSAMTYFFPHNEVNFENNFPNRVSKKNNPAFLASPNKQEINKIG